MTNIRYTSFVCEQEDLENRLNRLGAEGWQLHTCDPVVSMGQQGTGTLNAFVVMVKIDDSEPEESPTEPQFEGIAMRG